MRAPLHHLLKRTGPWLAVLLLPLAAHAQAPANDDPAGAIPLPLAATCAPTSATTVGATTSGATNTTGGTSLGYTNPGCGVAINPKDVWFTFTTAAAGQPGSNNAVITVAGAAAGQVRVFSGGAGSFTSVGCASGGLVNTQAPALYLTGLAAATTYYVFVSGYGSNDAPGAFTICVTVPPANDVAVEQVLALTQLPIPQGAPHVVRARVANRGLNPQTNVSVTLTVASFTSTKTVALLVPGTATLVSFDPFTPTATGATALTVTTPPDGNNANNSLSAALQVNATTFSYADAGAATNSSGYGPTTSYNVLACRFLAGTALNVTQVRAYLVDQVAGTTTVGKTVFGVLMDAGGNVLARSADRVVAAADLNTYVSFPMPTPYPSLPAGTNLYVGLAQTYQPGQTTQYYALGTQGDGLGRAGAFYATSTTTLIPPYDLSQQGAHTKFMLEAVTADAPLCAPVTNLTAGSITPTGATLAFTAPAGASSYIVTYAANGGPVTPLTPAPTASPVVLTGLSPATAYAVTVTTSCGGGQVSLPATFSFTTATSSAPYAPLPVAEGFEGPWLSVNGVRDAPAASWRNSPATGNQSWRREDDGTSANWLTNAGAYTPASSQGAHSARFNSYDAPLNSTGALDLYVNMGPAGAKTLTFDYINLGGTDVLDVLVSTDGGTTFSPTPVLTAGISPTFTARTVGIASTSATTVIRFRATSDYGPAASDIGLDNVRLAVVTATRNEALAATVGLYPNPAHRGFTLAVPAGPLGAATATLRNSLGQVVQQRPLGLPAAGGTATFDVRGLAAGVYALQLQAGETLVVKRVVVE